MTLTRRSFIQSTTLVGAVGATVAYPITTEAAASEKADLTGIPTHVVDKIKAWQDANRAAAQYSDACRDALHAVPNVPGEYARLVVVAREANSKAERARDAMIMALWSV